MKNQKRNPEESFGKRNDSKQLWKNFNKTNSFRYRYAKLYNENR